MLYAIHGTVEIHGEIWTSSRQIPTFYLHANVQGIVDEAHAQRIAQDILEAGIPEDDDHVRTWHITAYKTEVTA